MKNFNANVAVVWVATAAAVAYATYITKSPYTLWAMLIPWIATLIL